MIRSVFSCDLIESRSGFIRFKVSGKNAVKAFSSEAGGHRWQRIPPTEKRGRRQTSTITVAVLKEPSVGEVSIDNSRLRISTCRGSGAGGQHRNVTDSAVQIVYGDISIRCESERSQHRNKQMAMSVLMAKLYEIEQNRISSSQNGKRKEQVGTGMRGDKVRTIRVFDDSVVNHLNGKRMKYKKYSRGFLADIL